MKNVIFIIGVSGSGKSSLFDAISFCIFDKTKTLELNITSNDELEAYQFARIINHYQGFKLII